VYPGEKRLVEPFGLLERPREFAERSYNVRHWTDALRRWRELGRVFDEALCIIDIATLLDPADSEVSAAAEAAREILVRLGAKPFLARLDAALERQRSESAPEPERSRDTSSV
jgi:hypothetical protein